MEWLLQEAGPQKESKAKEAWAAGGAGGFHLNGGVKSPKTRLPGSSLRLNVKRP